MKESIGAIIALALLLAGPVTYLVFSTKYDLLDFNHDIGPHILYTVLGIWGAFMALFLIGAQGQAEFKKEKVYKTIVFGAMFGALTLMIASFIFGCILWYNGSGGQAITKRELELVSQRTTRGRHKRCYVEIRSPKDAARTLELSFPLAACNTPSSRQLLELETSPGNLGYEWIRTSTLINKPQEKVK